jgi:transcriptional regulator with XRE-family HTH domain
MPDIKGERIRRLRLARGMTQQALADATGGLVTKQAISKYERGKSQPSPVVLRTLADVFGVKTADLFRPPTARIEFVAYRKKSRLGKRKQTQIEHFVRHRLEERLRLQELIGQLRDIQIPVKQWPVATPDDAEDAADALRDTWTLGVNPIASVTDVLEDRHVHVISLDAPDAFDGISALAYDDDTPVAAAVVCHADRPGERQRLNLTHELAHLVLDVSDSEDFDEEDAAYRMGAAFLAPRDAVFREVGTRRHSIQAQELLLLKRYFGMSMQALLYRMKDLEIISQHHYTQWFKHINKMGWRKDEPESLDPERSTWLRRSVLRAYSEELLSKEESERLLGESIDEDGAPGPLVKRRAFMELPMEERRKILSRQAEAVKEHYEETTDERQAWQGGDIVDYGDE